MIGSGACKTFNCMHLDIQDTTLNGEIMPNMYLQYSILSISRHACHVVEFKILQNVMGSHHCRLLCLAVILLVRQNCVVHYFFLRKCREPHNCGNVCHKSSEHVSNLRQSHRMTATESIRPHTPKRQRDREGDTRQIVETTDRQAV